MTGLQLYLACLVAEFLYPHTSQAGTAFYGLVITGSFFAVAVAATFLTIIIPNWVANLVEEKSSK